MRGGQLSSLGGSSNFSSSNTPSSSSAKLKTGAKVTANYKGSLLSDGTVFDENSNGSFNFALGQGRVIKCWETAFAQMKVGEKVTITCPPEMAYGSKGAGGVIPPNAALQFDVETVNCVP